MARNRIDHLILNSPYCEPALHWSYERETRMFFTERARRPAGYVRATADSKAFDDPGMFVELALVNQIRPATTPLSRASSKRRASSCAMTGNWAPITNRVFITFISSRR